MLTAAQIRQQFLDFFREKKHTIVPSSSLMPDSPNLLFTNAGMNQFVPIFLGEKSADVSKWGGAIPGSDTRAADTQKCIRAGGKHNDLDDVGLDTYHHTFFEMLGNWSFGDYFKKEAIDWAWELVVQRWKFPANRVYATVYFPALDSPTDHDFIWKSAINLAIACAKGEVPKSDLPHFQGFDADAAILWTQKFLEAGLDPAVHIVPGNKKDNFWMMGETGPCGPCSELHIDLTPKGDTKGHLVNKGVPECIEIWNLVFIQFNAQPSAVSSSTGPAGQQPAIEFVPLAQQHVDTGMGFERVTSIIQGTKGFTDFANAKISNYETDIFRPIFDELEKMSGKHYASTLPSGSEAADVVKISQNGPSSEEMDGIQTPPKATQMPVEASQMPQEAAQIPPSGTPITMAGAQVSAAGGQTSVTGEQEAVPGGQVAIDVAFRVIADHIRTLSFAIADGIQPGNTDRNYVLRRILRRAVRYGRTLDFREPFFYKLVAVLARTMGDTFPELRAKQKNVEETLRREEEAFNKTLDRGIAMFEEATGMIDPRQFANIWIGANLAFKLYDTYGFPLDLTELMARERGLKVDTEGFEKLMEEQRARARAAQKKQVIELSEIETKEPTCFVGYEAVRTPATVSEVVSMKGKTVAILDASVCYAEMGGQVGDTGEMTEAGQLWNILNTQKTGNTWLHFIESVMGADAPAVGADVMVSVDEPRRAAIQRHHTVTHLLHWALHEVVSREATQKGSFVGPDKLTFDFNSAALTPQQVRDVERLVNARIVENAPVIWTEVPYAEVRGRADVMQFFGDKYGETVRVVDIGGFSKELCAGTHTRATGEIGLFRIESEAAIAAGVRRIEAVAGLNAYDFATADAQRLHALAGKMGTPLADLEKRIEGMLAQQKELEKALKSASQREASRRADELIAKFVQTINGIPSIIANLGTATSDDLQMVADALKPKFDGVSVLGSVFGDSVGFVVTAPPAWVQRVHAGNIVKAIAPIVGGKGGGKPDNARGGGKDPSKLDAALAHARTLL